MVSGTCDYIRWVERCPAPSTATSDDDPFPSSSSAPSLTSTPSLASTWQAPPFSASLIEKCRHITHTNTSCKSTCVLPNCGCGMCHKHCMESGGCLGKGHLANGSLRTAVAARIVGTPLPSQRQPDPPRQPVPTTSASDYTSTPATATQPEPNSDGEADLTWDARFVSHMPDVFNRQCATQQRLQEKKRSEDEERLRSKKKADETVIGYAFVEVCVPFATEALQLMLNRMTGRLLLPCSRITPLASFSPSHVMS